MRDLETISLALTAAETGHLVFGTLHTKSAPKTIDRIIDAFPPAQQQQVRVQLAEALQGVISQILLPTKDRKGRVAALEIMVATVAIRNLIREGKTHQMPSSIQTGTQVGHAEPGAGAPEPRDAGTGRPGPRRGLHPVHLVGLGRARSARARPGRPEGRTHDGPRHDPDRGGRRRRLRRVPPGGRRARRQGRRSHGPGARRRGARRPRDAATSSTASCPTASGRPSRGAARRTSRTGTRRWAGSG